MFDSNQTTEFFDTLARILLRCWIFGCLRDFQPVACGKPVKLVAHGASLVWTRS